MVAARSGGTPDGDAEAGAKKSSGEDGDAGEGAKAGGPAAAAGPAAGRLRAAVGPVGAAAEAAAGRLQAAVGPVSAAAAPALHRLRGALGPAGAAAGAALAAASTGLTVASPLLCLGAGLWALYHPSTFGTTITGEWVRVCLALLMLSMGLTLSLDDVVGALRRPLLVLLSLALEYGVAPLWAFTLGHIFRLSPPLRAGLTLMGSVNGGQASNLCTYLSYGDVAASVLMTLSSSLLATGAIPALSHIYLSGVVDVDAGGLASSTAKLVLAPLAVGVATKAVAGRVVAAVEPVLPMVVEATAVATASAWAPYVLLRWVARLPAAAATATVAAVVGVRCGGVDVRVGKGGGDAPAEEEGAGTVAALLAGELAPTGGGGMDGGGAPAKAATPLATPPRRGRGRGGRGNGRGRGGRPCGGRGVAAAAAAAVAAALDGDAAVAAAAAAVGGGGGGRAARGGRPAVAAVAAVAAAAAAAPVRVELLVDAPPVPRGGGLVPAAGGLPPPPQGGDAGVNGWSSPPAGTVESDIPFPPRQTYPGNE
ncbi:hypothetical protein I4F81_005085 [Pyropia yezoensis]|uniref:Uncharacterized protein n=1 Tax=Pyropia yezoensis TaxID=2788 RepID=A0ACC3BX90_PYRYE|nr:hypothetical protein I4F81_005085 [Neopyropia yezoensis]